MLVFQIISIVLLVVCCVLLTLLVLLRKLYLQERQNLIKINDNLSDFRAQNGDLKIQIATLESNLAQKEQLEAKLREIHATQMAQLREDSTKNLAILKEQMEKNLKEQNLAILAQNKLMINQDSKKILDSIFMPLQQQISEYSKNLTANEASLKNHIEHIFTFSQKIGENADKLATILKGEKKTRGNFAELQLKAVLESSGLVEGSVEFGGQYLLQASFSDEDGIKRPDAVVFLDKDKSVVIDSKFSLPNDFSFDSLDERVCREISENLKSRIDELSKKQYSKFGSYTYDFVLLFIPYGNILDLALSVEPNLYQYAYKKQIYLTTPNTLFMALNTISISWRHINSNQNVLKAFDEIGKFYDKFCGVVEEFERVKGALKSLDSSIESVDKRLLSGNGSLASRFENLKNLGIKTQKSFTLESTK